jgi:hypothetical protein
MNARFTRGMDKEKAELREIGAELREVPSNWHAKRHV